MAKTEQIEITCDQAGRLRRVPLGDLHRFQGMLKTLSVGEYDKLKASIIKYGFFVPVFVWKNKILDGHQRLFVIEKEGWELAAGVPVVDIEAETETEAAEKLLILSSTYGKVEPQGLYEFTQTHDISLAEFDLPDLPDFDLESFKDEFYDEEEEDEGAADEVPDAPEVPTSQTGDLWLLGDHRLLCGDSTSGEDVARLMDGQQADMVFADPPYGMNKEIINDNLKEGDLLSFYKAFTDTFLSALKVNGYFYVWGYFDGLSRYWEQIIKPQGQCNFRNFIIWKKNSIQGINSPEYRQFPVNYEAALLCIYGQPFQNGPWSTSPNADGYWDGFDPIRLYLDGERKKMGWDIPTVKKMVGHSDLSRDHWFGKSQWSFPPREVYEIFRKNARVALRKEYVAFRKEYDALRKEYDALRKEYDALRKEYDALRGDFDNNNGLTDIWESPKLTTTTEHPTVKPIEICENGIISTSKIKGRVLDPFLGSGSTLIACEKTDRQCYGLEIDPHYCDVIVQRWQDYTGQEATLEGDGRTFGEVSEERGVASVAA